MTRSSKRIPIATSRSASWMAALTQASPCIPIIPRLRGCVAGKPPSPRRVWATGIPVRSTSSSKSSVAPASTTP